MCVARRGQRHRFMCITLPHRRLSEATHALRPKSINSFSNSGAMDYPPLRLRSSILGSKGKSIGGRRAAQAQTGRLAIGPNLRQRGREAGKQKGAHIAPNPQLTSTSTEKASIPLTAVDKTHASKGGCWANSGSRAMRFLQPGSPRRECSNLTSRQPKRKSLIFKLSAF